MQKQKEIDPQFMPQKSIDERLWEVLAEIKGDETPPALRAALDDAGLEIVEKQPC